MSHNEVYRICKTLFPLYMEKAEAWYPNGKNSIRIRIANNMDFIFTFNGRRNWKFETVDSFLKEKGDK